jgi:hypothetical protein
VSEPSRKDRTAADRQRRRRMRQKCGVQLYPIELDVETIGRLLDHGLITLDDLTSRDALAFALGAAFEEYLHASVSRRDVPQREAPILRQSKKGA